MSISSEKDSVIHPSKDYPLKPTTLIFELEHELAEIRTERDQLKRDLMEMTRRHDNITQHYRLLTRSYSHAAQSTPV